MNVYYLIFVLLVPASVLAQGNGFPFGSVSYKELEIKTYRNDTSAEVLILKEFGEAFIDNENNHNLIFQHHTKTKILKQSGLAVADFEIPLYKQNGRAETLKFVKASSFTFQNGTMVETKLDSKNIFTENRSKYFDIIKFAVPNVRVGSVIEIQYTLESPFIFNFRTWNFQNDYPKVTSEYWATIPGNYLYNMSLKGYLKLSKNENEIIKDGFSPGGNKADCIRYKYKIDSIPAFKVEDFMTAKSNFVSSINFELSQIKYFDGRVDKYTKEWKDADLELRRDSKFGLQLKRGGDIVDKNIDALMVNENDQLVKAKKIYRFINEWYTWDGVYGKYSELGIKKAFEKRSGNVGDINLSLIAALNYAGINAEPVILSTRENGLPIDIHPVLSDFNYVIARVTIGDKIYLADASDNLYPFGIIPERCLNGKGRALGEKESFWIDLKPQEKGKSISIINLKLDTNGVIKGNIQNTYLGYEAVAQRRKFFSFDSEKEYQDHLTQMMPSIHIKKLELKDANDMEKPFIQNLEIEFETNAGEADYFLFNPFMMSRWKENPFKSDSRLYPVDFGAPVEIITSLNFEYRSDTYELANLPEKIGVALPNAGGKYLVAATMGNNMITLSNLFAINKTVFSSQEYHYLKELFNKMLQVQSTDFLFRKKI